MKSIFQRHVIRVATVHTSCFCLLCGQLFSCDMSASAVHLSDVQRTVRVRKEVSTEWEFNCYFKKFFLTRHFYHYFLTILLIFHTPILHTFAFFFFFHTRHFPRTCWYLTKDIFWSSIFNFNHISTKIKCNVKEPGKVKSINFAKQTFYFFMKKKENAVIAMLCFYFWLIRSFTDLEYTGSIFVSGPIIVIIVFIIKWP